MFGSSKCFKPSLKLIDREQGCCCCLVSQSSPRDLGLRKDIHGVAAASMLNPLHPDQIIEVLTGVLLLHHPTLLDAACAGCKDSEPH